MCGASGAGPVLGGVNAADQAVVQGQVLRGPDRDGGGSSVSPVTNAYVRLHDAQGEFVGEVPTSSTGHFRFFAGDGSWILRTLAPAATTVDHQVVARRGTVTEVTVRV